MESGDFIYACRVSRGRPHCAMRHPSSAITYGRDDALEPGFTVRGLCAAFAAAPVSRGDGGGPGRHLTDGISQRGRRHFRRQASENQLFTFHCYLQTLAIVGEQQFFLLDNRRDVVRCGSNVIRERFNYPNLKRAALGLAHMTCGAGEVPGCNMDPKQHHIGRLSVGKNMPIA